MILAWSSKCVLADMTVNAGVNPAIVVPSGATFKITDTKLYAPIVTLSKGNDRKLLEQSKLGFKRTIKWNKYRSQITIQLQNHNLSYSVYPTFTDVNRLFVLSFQKIVGENNTTKYYRDSFSLFHNSKFKFFHSLE